MLNPNQIVDSYNRIKDFVKETPIITSSLLNELLGNNIFFKAESFQKIGAFKIRGVFNTILSERERGNFHKKIVAYSSGNHAQGVAYACKILGIEAVIIMPSYVSKVKQFATRYTGAQLILTDTRDEAEEVAKDYQQKGYFLIPPFDNDDVILGNGTTTYETLLQLERDYDVNADYVFAACGGGGLLSGSYLATKLFNTDTKVIGVEPVNANDATISLKQGKIFKFDKVPNTIADGVRTLAVAPRTFEYLQNIDSFINVEEEEIIYWMQWIIHLLKISVEPACACAMAACHKFIKENPDIRNKNLVVILSGGNVDKDTYQKIWSQDYLSDIPSK